MNTLGPSVPVQSSGTKARGEGAGVDGAGFADAFDGAFGALGPSPAAAGPAAPGEGPAPAPVKAPPSTLKGSPDSAEPPPRGPAQAEAKAPADPAPTLPEQGTAGGSPYGLAPIAGEAAVERPEIPSRLGLALRAPASSPAPTAAEGSKRPPGSVEIPAAKAEPAPLPASTARAFPTAEDKPAPAAPGAQASSPAPTAAEGPKVPPRSAEIPAAKAEPAPLPASTPRASRTAEGKPAPAAPGAAASSPAPTAAEGPKLAPRSAAIPAAKGEPAPLPASAPRASRTAEGKPAPAAPGAAASSPAPTAAEGSKRPPGSVEIPAAKAEPAPRVDGRNPMPVALEPGPGEEKAVRPPAQRTPVVELGEVRKAQPAPLGEALPRPEGTALEALLRNDTRRGSEVLLRGPRTPSHPASALPATQSTSRASAKATATPGLQGLPLGDGKASPAVLTPKGEGGSLARASFDQRLAQASGPGAPLRVLDQGSSATTASSSSAEAAASGNTVLSPSFEFRSPALTPPVVEGRLGPALLKDLQQQFASLEEGTSRTVELRLDPPELGRVTVRISLVGDEARVAFTAAQGSAREALEAALPRLREMFDQAGLSLGDAQVGSGPGQDSRGRGRAGSDVPGGARDPGAEPLAADGLEETPPRSVNSPARGRLDLRV